jgi:RHS repeat-associated protein
MRLSDSWRHVSKRRKSQGRSRFFEHLEERRLLASDWRNPVDALDVNSDRSVTPLDVLQVINDVNFQGPRVLSATRPHPTPPFVDVDGDGRAGAGDALQVVNALNAGIAGARRLRDGGETETESITIGLGQDRGSRFYSFSLDVAFPPGEAAGQSDDRLEVYLIDPDNPRHTLLDGGTPGSPLLVLQDGAASYPPSLVRMSGSQVRLDLTSLGSQGEGELQFRLLDNDGRQGTEVLIRPLSNDVVEGVLVSSFPALPNLAPNLTLESQWLLGTGGYEEIGFVKFDDASGAVGGVAPGDPGYSEAVRNSPSRRTLFTDEDGAGSQHAVTVAATDLLGVYVFHSDLAQAPAEDHLRVRTLSGDAWQIGWEDSRTIWPGLIQVGDRGYDDAVIQVQAVPAGTGPLELAPVDDQQIDEQTLLTVPLVATGGTAPAGLTFSLLTGPAGAAVDAGTGRLTWTPDEAQGPGTFPVSVAVQDAAGAQAAQSFSITVREVNRPPVLAVIGDRSVDEETTLSFTAGATDPDLPANTLTFSLVNAPAGASIDAATGLFQWTPSEAQGPGSYPLTVRVSDGGLFDDEPITITVREVNRPPVLAAIGDRSVDEEITLNFTAGATDPDLPANTLTFSLVNAPAGSSIDAATGLFQWTPTEAQGPGSYPLTVRVSDGVLFDDEPITITVREVNRPPVLAAIGDRSVDEETTLNFTAGATDPDLPANTLTFSLVNAPAGASIDAATGLFQWTPTEAQGPGSYPLTVRVSDGGLFDDEPITITVREVNRPPVLAAIGDRSVEWGQLLSLTANASDPDLPANGLTFSLGDAPAGASIDASTGLFEWTPAVAQAGATYDVTVRVTDDGTPALSDETTFQVQVTGCTFADDLAGWTAAESGGSDGARGTVAGQNCAALLTEGDSFEVTLTGQFTVPAEPSALVITIDDPQFDTSDPDFVNDAFEAALVNAAGQSVVFPFLAGRDAFFNVTEGLGASAGPEVTINGNEIRLDLSNVPAGTQAQLVLRLVNNDSDTASQVRIRRVEMVSGGLRLLGGSEGGMPPAAGALPAGASTAGLDNGILQPVAISINRPPAPATGGYGPAPLAAGSPSAGNGLLDNRGTEFWVAFPDNLDGEITHTLFLAGDVATTGTVSVPGLAFSADFAVNPGEVTAVVLPKEVDIGEIHQVVSKGVHVVAQDPISVYGLNRLQFTTDAYLAFPTASLGTEYLALAYESTERLLAAINGSQVVAVATQDDTTVRFQPGPRMTATSYVNVQAKTPTNATLFSDTQLNDRGPLFLPASGSYPLTVTPYFANQAGEYRFQWFDLAADATPLVFGQGIQEDLATGQALRAFKFNGVPGQWLYYNGLDSDFDNVAMSIVTPSGVTLESRNADDSFGPFALTESGEHYLLIDGRSNAPSDFAFRLLDVSSPAPLTLGATVTGTFGGGQHVDLWSFAGTAGQQLVYDGLDGDRDNVAVYLLAPGGGVLWNLNADDDAGFATLPEDGTYYVVLDNRMATAVDYSFRVLDVASAAPITPGATVSGVTATGQAMSLFRFAGTAGGRYYYDGLDGDFDNVTARLYTASGLQITGLNADGDSAQFILDGDGPVTVLIQPNLANPGDFAFRIWDAAAAPALPLTTAVSGSLPGGRELQLFTLNGTAGQTLLFDSLDDDGEGVVFRLLDSGGNQPLYVNANANSSIFRLTESGTYYATIEANHAGAADYHFRLLDVPAVVQPLVLDADTSGVLATGRETVVYQFTGAVGQRLVYDALDSDNDAVNVRLVEPGGDDLVFRNSDQDTAPFTLTRAGVYYLVIEGGTAAGADYAFRLHDAANAPELAADSVTNGTLAVPRAMQLYRLTPGAAQYFVYDGLSASPVNSASAVLFGPANQQFASVTVAGDFNHTTQFAGQYLLAVTGSGSSGPLNYSFQTSLTAEAPVAPSGFGSTQSISIAAGEQKVYSFSGAAGTAVVLDVLAPFAANLVAEIRGPANQFITSTGGSSDTGVAILPVSGDYELRIRGNNASATGTLTFRLLNLTADAPPLAPGDTAGETLPAGGTFAYRVPRAAGQRLYYDALDADFDNVTLQFIAPGGTVLQNPNADSDWLQSPLRETGDFFLVVRNNLTADADYRFRIIDQDAAPLAAWGSEISGNLAEGRSKEVYRFQGTLGQKLVVDGLDADFDAISVSVYTPADNHLFLHNADSDRDRMTLPLTGTYYVYVDGALAAAADYRFRLLDAGASPPIAFGAEQSGTFPLGREIELFRFQGTAGQRIVFDGLDNDNDNVAVTLVEPGQRAVFQVNADRDSGLVTLASTGEYTLTVAANAAAGADYRFRTLDADAPAPIAFQTPVAGTFPTGRDTSLFQFTGAAGQTIYYDGLDDDTDNATASIYAPSGARILQIGAHQESGLLTLSESGAYRLIVSSEQSAGGDFAFQLLDVAGLAPLTLGSVVSGTLPTGREAVLHPFQGTAGQRLVYDGLDGDFDNVNARLIGPRDTAFGNSDSDTNVFTLRASGTYYLVIEGSVNAAADFAFRLWDVAQVPVLSFDVPVTGTLAPGHASQLYQFAASSGADLLFDNLSASASGAAWHVIGLGNQNLNNRGLTTDLPAQATAAGTYLLRIQGSVAATINYEFQATQTPATPVAGTGFGADTTVVLGMGETKTLDFAGTAGRLVMFDGRYSRFQVPTFDVVLDAGEVYQLRDLDYRPHDVTGTVVTADKPIAVFGSHVCTFIPGGYGFCDHLADQMPPTSSWGRQFVTVPLATRTKGDTFRFLAQADNTEVRVNGTLVATLDRGELHERILTAASEIAATRPILVAQYSNSAEYDGTNTDPFMMLIPPYEQFLAGYTVTTPATGFDRHFINLVVPTDGVGDVTLDGTAVPSGAFTPIGASGFSGAQVEVAAGTHQLAGALPFGVFIYGFALHDSYGYTGGQSLSPVALASNIALTPPAVTLPLGQSVTVAALVTDIDGRPLEGLRVDFVVAGSHPQQGFAFTDALGQAVFSYLGDSAGSDVIEATLGNLFDTSTVTWLAPAAPPSIEILSPAGDTALASAGRLTVSGRALADVPLAEIVLVTVNGRPVDVLDPAGNFFAQVDVLPGENHFTFIAYDSLDGMATIELVASALQRPPGEVDFSRFADITGSFEPEYARTSYHHRDQTLFADIAISNVGQYPADAPLLVGVTHLSDPAVRVLEADGVTPDGIPYYDFTGLVTGGTLAPRSQTGFLAARFLNPTGQQFTYDLVFFGRLNEAPLITTTPGIEAFTGRLYGYDADAVDPDQDALVWSLVTGPDGLTIDPGSGLAAWTPGAGDLGTHDVTLRVQDGRGGVAEQRYLLTLSDPLPNRPPVWASIPATAACAGAPYEYDADAVDADGDALVYRLVTAPPGMTVDAATGLIAWSPAAGLQGQVQVELEADDQAGGTARQAFALCLCGEAPTSGANTAPVFHSQPPATAAVGVTFHYLAGAQDAEGHSLLFSLVEAPAGMALQAVAADPNAVVVTWDPAVEGQVQVTLRVTDSLGATADQSFELDVAPAGANRDPVITSQPRASIPLGRTWFYQVTVADADGDLPAFSLAAAPAGMTIDALGLAGWTPEAADLGPRDVTVRVDDGRGGSATQIFAVTVVTDDADEAPWVTSTPALRGVVDELYRYDLAAHDPDLDPVEWSLQQAPAGMSIDPRRGTLRWTPTIGQLGAHQVVVAVRDPFLAEATQTFSVVVACENLPPAITSRPATQANVGRGYLYAVGAIDPERDALTFSLAAGPQGMTLDAATGLVRWTPAAAQIGTRDVSVQVSDTAGNVVTQTFSIEVTQAVLDRPPVITSRPSFRATAENPYQYQVVAADPEGQLVTYSLVGAPAGMAISSTGLVTWTPALDQAGPHIVNVAADDPAGNRATQRFALQVRVNQAPEIVSAPVTSVVAATTYRYDVQVREPDNDPVVYGLVSGPAGLSIDPVGRVRWEVPPDAVGPFSVTVRATDPFGAADAQTFEIAIAPDTEPPQVVVQLSVNPAALGTSVVLTVTASDNVGVAGLSLTVGGQPLVLSSQGTASFSSAVAGSFLVAATATDRAGNTGTASTTLRVFDPADTQGPTVEITSPTAGAVVTTLTDIVGTVSDPNLDFYRLDYGRADLVDINAPAADDADWITFAGGNASVVASELGVFDPTLLRNDNYVIRVVAQDLSGNVTARTLPLSLEGNLKLGQFRLEFTDLTIPLAGIPITVTRVYDTRQADESGDFGFGWSLGVQDAQVRETLPVNDLERQGLWYAAAPFRDGTRVYLNTPDGRRVGFTFEVTPQFSLFGGGYFLPRFRPDPGVYDSLEVDPTPLLRRPDGSYFIHFLGFPYNPSVYRLTTKQGVTYQYNQFEGLERITDRNGNTIEFRDDGIFSSTGAAVTFRRDPVGRIAQVIDPAGIAIGYEYDADGNLAALLDARGNQTGYRYLDDPEHFLQSIIDPHGHESLVAEFDADGRLISNHDALGHAVLTSYDLDQLRETITDPLGNVTVTAYDQRGNIRSVTDDLGATLSFTYDAQDNVLTATDALGQTVERTYDTAGNVTSMKDPLGNVTQMTHAPDGQVTSVTDARGSQSRLVYDAQGRLIEFVNAAGVASFYEYDSQGRTTSYTDNLGRRTEYTYGSGPRPISVTDDVLVGPRLLAAAAAAAGTPRQYEYNQRGQVTKETDENGHVTTYTYDAAGLPLSRTDALGNVTTYSYDARGQRVSVRDALGRVMRTEYDDAGRPVRFIDASGAVTETEYDARNQPVRMTDPLGNVTETQYRADGQITAIIDPLRNTTAYEYDLAGNRTAVIDARGNRTSYEYDSLGRITQETGPLGGIRLYVYDSAGNLTSTTDPNSHAYTMTYDALGRRTTLQDPLGGLQQFAYDASGNLIAMTDALGRVTSYEYDSRDRLIETVDPAGADRQFTYDGVGNLLTAADELGQTTTYAYDAADRLVTQTDPLGGQTRYQYDAAGNRLSVTDPLNRTTAFTVDSMNRVTAMRDPADAVTGYAYDAAGRRTSVTDPLNQITRYEYDARGLLVKRTDPLGEFATFAYDAVGNQVETVDRNGQTRRFVYDALNRVTEEKWLTAGTTVRTIAFGYDAAGNLLSVQDPDSHYVFQYDALDRMTSSDNAGTPRIPHVTLSYAYDAVGNGLSITDNLGVQAGWTYDLRNLPTSLTWQGTGIDPARVDFTYNARGERTQAVRFGDLAGTQQVGSSVLGYDAVGRLTSLTHRNAVDAVLAEYDYAYDLASQLIEESHHGQTSSYQYDPTSQLLEADHSLQPDEQYAYDANGNPVDAGMSVGANNKVSADARFDYQYDQEGSLIRKTERATGAFTRYEYDHRKRLTAVEDFDSLGTSAGRSTFTYDAFDRRIVHTAGGQTTATVYSAAAIWADFDAAGDVQARYLAGPLVDEWQARQRPGEGIAWYLADRLGTVRDIADGTGAVVDHIDYDSFGGVVAETNPALGDRLKFTGREFDADTGLYYYRARYYDPALRRFVSEDPLGFRAGDGNLQRYVGNSPVNGSDPSGLQAIIEMFNLEAFVGMYIGLAFSIGSGTPFTFRVGCSGGHCGISGGPDQPPSIALSIPGPGSFGPISWSASAGVSNGAPAVGGGFGTPLGGVSYSYTFPPPKPPGPGPAPGGGGSWSFGPNIPGPSGAGLPYWQDAPPSVPWPEPPSGEFEFLVQTTAVTPHLIISFNTAIFVGVATELSLIAKVAVADDGERLVEVHFEKAQNNAAVKSYGMAKLPTHGRSPDGGNGGPDGGGPGPVPPPTPPTGSPAGGAPPAGTPSDGDGGDFGGGTPPRRGASCVSTERPRPYLQWPYVDYCWYPPPWELEMVTRQIVSPSPP